MTWIIQFLTSSIGKKLIMALTGLFLILFLTVHLLGNLQLLNHDGGEGFNVYTHFMGHNPVIQTIAFGNYFFILLHAIQGILLAMENRKAKGGKYAVAPRNGTSWTSNNMALLGLLVLAFLLIHMGDFWFKFKFGDNLPMVTYDGQEMINAYQKVQESLTQIPFVIIYLIGLLALGLHLNHGFSSAFQTLGLRHQKYTPIIKSLGRVYAIIIPLGFAILPLYIYFTQQ